MKAIRVCITLLVMINSFYVYAKKPKEQEALVDSSHKANEFMKGIINCSAAVTYFAISMYSAMVAKRILFNGPEKPFHTFEDLLMLSANLTGFITLMDIAYQRGYIGLEAFNRFFKGTNYRTFAPA